MLRFSMIVALTGCVASSEDADPDVPDVVDASTWIGTYDVISSVENHREGSTVRCLDEPKTPYSLSRVIIKAWDLDPAKLAVESCTADGLCETLDIFRVAGTLEHSGAYSLGDDGSSCTLRADRNRATLDTGLVRIEGLQWARTNAMSSTCSFEQAHALLDTPDCDRVFTIEARRDY